MWHATTATEFITGSSSMGALSALNRAVVGIPASVRITSYLCRWQVGLGAGSSTYNSFTTGNAARAASWVVGISYVPTGGSVPNLASAPDDSDFLWLSYSTPGYDRQTINTAGSPAYKDLFSWRDEIKGRTHVNSVGGGTIYWHLWNIDGVTNVTDWSVMLRASYA